VLFERFLPEYDVSTTIEVRVAADASQTWQALDGVDLIEVGKRWPLVGLLGGIRVLPEIASNLAHGEGPPRMPERMTLRDTTLPQFGPGAWTLLGERPRCELSLGLVGKFWRPVIEYVEIDAASFTDFDRPGFAKTVYALAVAESADGGALLTGTMRTATTSESARRWFNRYWTLGVGCGAHVLVRGLLELVREDAEGSNPERKYSTSPAVKTQ
jgi:hypothetical protein